MPARTDSCIIGCLLAPVRAAFALATLLCSAGILVSAYAMYLKPEEYPLLSLAGFVFPAFAATECLLAVFFLLARKFWSAAFTAVTIAVCAPQIYTYMPFMPRQKDAPQGSIKLLSYNTMSMGDLKMKDGESALVNYLRDSHADIICLQEFRVYNRKGHLSQQIVDKGLESLPHHKTIAIGESKQNRIVCYSRYPILSAEGLELPGKDNGAAAYRLLVDGDTLQIISVHLESNKLNSEDKEMYHGMINKPEQNIKVGTMRHLVGKLVEANTIRQSQADGIRSYMDSHPCRYTIVCGDFNCPPLTYAHHTLSQGMNDAFVQSGHGLGISYNQDRFYFRIDHILASRDIKTYGCRVDNSIRESDHYPIYCHLTLEDNRRQ